MYSCGYNVDNSRYSVDKGVKIKTKESRSRQVDPPPPKTLRPIYVYVSDKKKLLKNKK